MKIRLSDVMSVPEKVKTYECNLDIEEIKFQGNSYKILDDNDFDITISNLGKKKLGIKLNKKITLLLYCSRCINDIKKEFIINLDEVIDLSIIEKESVDIIDDISYIDNGFLDVDMLVINYIVPLIPITILCNEECLGLCKICGKNRNEIDCNCDQHIMSPQMAIFGEVFNNFNFENEE